MKVGQREDGAVAIITAICLVVIMAAVALTVDVGGLLLRRRELVNGADAAALSAARTARKCSDERFGTPEDAADYQVKQNSPITDSEVLPTNIVPSMSTQCGLGWGHVTVQYTSQQALQFAPVLGFDHESPVTTQATASWGLGSISTIPLILSNSLVSTCKNGVPPATPTIETGATCAVWYDNDDLNNGNFGFVSLYPQGWDVPQDDNCSSAQPGTSTLTDWIVGDRIESLALNWTRPTFVCASSGFHQGGNAGQAFNALTNPRVMGHVRDFPITWEGCGTLPDVAFCPPPGSSFSQGAVMGPNGVDKYDVIGFAAMKIVGVYRANDSDVLGSSTSTPTDWPATNYTVNNSGITFSTTPPAGATLDFSWAGTQNNRDKSGACGPVSVAGRATGTVFAWSSFGGASCPSNQITITDISTVTITYPVITTTPGVCGPDVPRDNSAICVLMEYEGSTLTTPYDYGRDNYTIVRLCDPDLGNCLDQKRGV